MNLIRFTLKNALFVNLLGVLILVGGGIAAIELKREAFPSVNFDVVTVSTWYPGASATEVERFVTDPLEESISAVSGIKRLDSTSIEGFSVLSIQIDPDEKDKKQVVADIEDAVDATADLPDEILDDPKIREIATRDTPIIEVSLSGLPEEVLREAAQDLEKRFLDIDDIGAVAFKGYRDREISIDVDPKKLEDYVMSIAQVSAIVASSNRNLPAGSIKTAEREYLVRTEGESKTAAEISEVVLRSNDLGELIRLKDVATVTEQFEETDRIFRTDSEPSINLVVIKKEAGDAIQLVQGLDEVKDEFLKADKFPGLKIAYLNDYSVFVKRRLGVLIDNAKIGILLVVLSLILFLSPGVSMMTAIGLPIAFAGALAGMSFFGTSINLISMFGLIIVLGIVVDDAIIVAENVYHHYGKGETPLDATVKGASEVLLPVTATILTTVAAFSPLMMMSGIMGKFLFDMPLAVIVALAVSWFESLIILPSHLYDVMKFSEWRTKMMRKFKGVAEGDTMEPGIFGRISQGVGNFKASLGRGVLSVYKAQLRFMLWGRYVTLVLAFGFFAFSGWWAQNKMQIQLFPSDGIEQFFVRVKMKTGTDLNTTSETLAAFEKILAELPDSELLNYTTDVGKTQNDPNDPFAARGSHLGQIQVFLTPENDRERIADDIIAQVRDGIAALNLQYEDFTVEKMKNGPPEGKPVAVEIKGENYEDLVPVAEEIRKRLLEVPGVIDPQDDYEEGKLELIVKVDRARAAIRSVDPESVAFQVRAAYEGLISTTIKRGDEELDVRVRFEEDVRNRLDSFDEIRIPNAFGRLVPLKDVATITERPGLGSVFHLDGDRIVTVEADIDEAVTSSLEVGERVLLWVPELEKQYRNIRIIPSGGFEDTKESMETLGRAFVLALFLIFMILSALFKSLSVPFVVLSSIPFALTGMIWAFYFHGMPLSFLGLMGAIGLIGVAVNDSIVLVTFNENQQKNGLPVIDATVEGSSRRVLAVWLTTVTTVVGLMPVAYGWGGFDPFLKPPAIAIGWGLTVATVVTLFIVPTVYVVRYTIVWDTIVLLTWLPRKLLGKEPIQRPALRISDLPEEEQAKFA